MLNQPNEKHVVPIMCHPAIGQAELERYSLLHNAAGDPGECVISHIYIHVTLLGVLFQSAIYR